MTVDNALRRNKIAALAVQYFEDTLENAEKVRAGGKAVAMSSTEVKLVLLAIRNALGGATTPEALNMHPASMFALGLAALTSEAPPQPIYRATENDL